MPLSEMYATRRRSSTAMSFRKLPLRSATPSRGMRLTVRPDARSITSTFWAPAGASDSPATKPMSSAHSQPFLRSTWKPSTLRKLCSGAAVMALPCIEGNAVNRAGPVCARRSSLLRVAGALADTRRGVLTYAVPWASKCKPAIGALTDAANGAGSAPSFDGSQLTPA